MSLRKHSNDVMALPVADSVLNFGTLTKSSTSSSKSSTFSSKSSTFINSVHDESTIECLIDKMKSGMEVEISFCIIKLVRWLAHVPWFGLVWFGLVWFSLVWFSLV